MEYLRKQQGMSLVELLVAVAVLLFGLVPLMSLFWQALKMTEQSHKRTIAISLMRDMQEEIRSKAFFDPDESSWPTLSGKAVYFPSGTTATPFGLEGSAFGSSDTRLTKLDDADDYNGWCRGQDCECGGTPPNTGSSSDGLCQDETFLEAYDGEKYVGGLFPSYQGFTRRVEIFNIYPNLSTQVTANEDRRGSEPRSHLMELGVGDNRETIRFNFYDLREENFDNLRAGADGKTRLKVVRVIVSYQGPVTPDVWVDDFALLTMPMSKETGE